MAQVTVVYGDMFASKCEALVNPVNCVGATGKGLAKQFEIRYPDYVKSYKQACKEGSIKVGSVSYYVPNRAGPTIFSFPTKTHWKLPSELFYIESGMDSLLRQVAYLGTRSVAIPALGCGNGHLDWDVVLPIILDKIHAAQFTVQPTFKIYAPELV